MSTSIKLEITPEHDLDYLNEQVAQGEMLGPLSDIGNAGGKTVLTFRSATKPPKHAVLAKLKDGAPVIPPGATLVCKGSVFISGELTECAATRG